jgi:hypothetical protein
MGRHHTADCAEEDHLSAVPGQTWQPLGEPWASPVLVQMWQPWASPVLVQMWNGMSPVPLQMCHRCCSGEPGPGADLAAASPVPVMMW